MDNIISSNSKVIFLDIDGVLNNEGVCLESGIYIDEFRVERLAKIVSKSGACIILTSAWRGAYRRYLASGEADLKVQIANLLGAEPGWYIRLYRLYRKWPILSTG